MVNQTQFKAAAELAVKNIINHGDTDIFPFPFENHAIFDQQTEFVKLIVEYNIDFANRLNLYSPNNSSSLTPVSYSGFRWATQIDPIWNAVFLSFVLAIANKMEAARIPISEKRVFSYRYKPDKKTGDLFDRNFGWFQFMQHSAKRSDDFQFVVSCDIAEFYPRLGHHRLENALKQVAGNTEYPSKIMGFLSNFSNTYSFGLPIGGPASRILSELTINQIDRLLTVNKIEFTRFADDYHLFAQSREEAHNSLIFLSEKLFTNQGLTLQKSKTRIMASTEFRATNPIASQLESAEAEQEGKGSADAHQKSQLLRFSLRFDPYSPTKDEDYERLKSEIRRFDIIALLKSELAKSRIHVALAKKIVSAIRYLEGTTKDDAIRSILDNCDILYPIFSSILLMIDQVFDDLDEQTQIDVIEAIQNLILNESHIFRVDVHLGYAIRVIAHKNTPEGLALLQHIYKTRTSPTIRRDIILAMARWREWYWLSDLKNSFRSLSTSERRAFIVASYTLKDEGKHWRDHIKTELDPFEGFIKNWAGMKVSSNDWEVPL